MPFPTTFPSSYPIYDFSPTTPRAPTVTPKFNDVKTSALSTDATKGIVAAVFIVLAVVVAFIANNNKKVLSKKSFAWSEIRLFDVAPPPPGSSPEEGDTAPIIDETEGMKIHVYRPAGAIMFILGMCELGIGLVVYSFWDKFPKVGAFWAAALALPAAGSAMYAKTRGSIISVCVLSSISIVVAAAAAATDGIAGAFWTSPAICGQSGGTGSGKYTIYGDTGDTELTNIMATYLLLGLGFLYPPDVCLCFVSGGGLKTASVYNLASPNQNTCADVRNSWMPNLAASCILCALICVLSFIMAIYSCIDLCRKPKPQIAVIQTAGYPQPQYPQQQLQYPSGAAPPQQYPPQQYPPQQQPQYQPQFPPQQYPPKLQHNVPPYEHTYAGGHDSEVGRGSEVQLAAFRNSGGSRLSAEARHSGGHR